MHTHMHTYTHLHPHSHPCTHTHAHTHTYTHTHTHTHTCTPSKLAISLGTFRRFSKVSSTLILYTEFSSELTFENTHLEVFGIRSAAQ